MRLLSCINKVSLGLTIELNTHPLLEGYEDASKVRNQITIARDILGTPAPSPLKIGVGFLAWTLDKNPQANELIEAALKECVKAVWFFAGNDLWRWIDFVRAYDSNRGISEDDEHRTRVFVQVNSVKEAIAAAERKVDVIVAQGTRFHDHSFAGLHCHLIDVCPIPG